jgi:two-component system, sensor histidine kinase RegB
MMPMSNDFSQHDSFAARRLRLVTLIRLRWLAVVGQSATVLFVAYYLHFLMPVGPCLALIACSALLNLLLSLRYPTNHRLEPPAALGVLAFDILQLAGLLFMTGGLDNPFSVLVIVPVIVSATSLPWRMTLVLAAAVIVAATILAFAHEPLPWYPDVKLSTPLILVAGDWLAIVSTLSFTGVYAYRVAEETRLLANALSATELVLQREQHLSALDGLAAAAAHELGTPLATIALVAKELQLQTPHDDRMAEDIELLRSQAERCRGILRRLTSLSSDDEALFSRMPLSSLVEEAIAPHRNFGVAIEVKSEKNHGPEPVLRRNPGVIYGIGNLVENAVDFARSTVIVTSRWTPDGVEISVLDDGHGFPADMLDRIGEPYASGRDREGQGGGLGLGLFIAKTLLERSGATLRFRNRREPGWGAEITATWPRSLVDQRNA